MTIQEVREKGLEAIRKPYWNPKARIELYRTPDGIYGPWADLIDPPGQAAIETGPQKLLMTEIDDGQADWEEYEA